MSSTGGHRAAPSMQQKGNIMKKKSSQQNSWPEHVIWRSADVIAEHVTPPGDRAYRVRVTDTFLGLTYEAAGKKCRRNVPTAAIETVTAAHHEVAAALCGVGARPEQLVRMLSGSGSRAGCASVSLTVTGDIMRVCERRLAKKGGR